jgi:hypothetical protein
MEKTFRPQKKVIIPIIVYAYSIAGFIFSIVVFSGNSARELTEAFIIIFGIATAYAIPASLSKITIKDDTLSTTTFIFSRHTTSMADIFSVTYLNNYAGMGEGLEIHYHGKRGFNRVMRVGIGAYGAQAAKVILNILRKQNPSIKFDHRVDNLAHS